MIVLYDAWSVAVSFWKTKYLAAYHYLIVCLSCKYVFGSDI